MCPSNLEMKATPNKFWRQKINWGEISAIYIIEKELIMLANKLLKIDAKKAK